MATIRPRVLQYGQMPLAQLDAELAQAYDVHILSQEADPDRFLAEHGAQFEYLVTSAAMGRDTAGLAEFIASKPANDGLRDMDARMVIQGGGLPVKFGKALVGGIEIGPQAVAAQPLLIDRIS